MTSEPKKRLKKKFMVRESHRAFISKTILAAKEQIDKREDPTVLKKLKFLQCTLLDENCRSSKYWTVKLSIW